MYDLRRFADPVAARPAHIRRVLRLYAGNKEENDDRLSENRLISAATDASGRRLSVCR